MGSCTSAKLKSRVVATVTCRPRVCLITLAELGFQVGRLKTGTNPRVHRSSIDFSKIEAQYGDADPVPFSHFTKQFPLQPQVACYITYTNDQTHQAIRKNMSRSPLYSGVIKGYRPQILPFNRRQDC
jgi:tRNA uridine 5-carboxymethylaminomethyl modification enzyme